MQGPFTSHTRASTAQASRWATATGLEPRGPSACCAGAPVCPQGVWWVAGETVFPPGPCTAPASPYGQLCKPLLSLAARAEPEASRRIAVAVLELGTVTRVPRSRNYQHSAWVSDLEQGAACPLCLPLPADRWLVIASWFVIIPMMIMAVFIGCVLWARLRVGDLMRNLLLPQFSPPIASTPGLVHDRGLAWQLLF